MVCIEHVSDYIELIEANTEKYGANRLFLYRGESRMDYKLIPSVFREKTINDVTAKVYLAKTTENDILKQFIKRAASYITVDSDDYCTWLEYAQHFGVPTRLLDWTDNPLVALYFASSNNKDQDGKVYLLNSHVYVELMKSTASEVGFMGLENTVRNMIEGLIPGFPYPVVFRPYYIDKRMLAQESCFMVWGNKETPLDEIIVELEGKGKVKCNVKVKDAEGKLLSCLEECEAMSHVVIPSDNKALILRELNTLGINQATLFPGLDGIGKSIEWNNNFFNTDIFSL